MSNCNFGKERKSRVKELESRVEDLEDAIEKFCDLMEQGAWDPGVTDTDLETSANSAYYEMNDLRRKK